MTVEKMVIFDVNDQSIHAREEGPPDAQIALLIHGWSSSWFATSPLLPLLSRRYHCIAVDLPGFGESPRLPVRATVSAYTDLLAELLRGVTDKPAILVGHSMGGMISLKMTIEYPELVERMVLLEKGQVVADGPVRRVLGDGRLLRSVGLDVPQPVALLEALREAGWQVRTDRLRPEEAVAEIDRAQKVSIPPDPSQEAST